MRRLFIGLLLIASVSPGRALAGAWLQPEGTAYLRLSGGVLSTESRFDQNGDSVPFDAAGGGFRDTGYNDLAFTLYGELGVHEDWTVLADITWKSVEADQPSALFTTTGLADVGLGIKRALWRGSRSVASVGGYLVIPSGYDPAEYPALGSDVAEGGLRLQAGTATARFWGNLEGNLRIRSGAFRDQIGGALTGGLTLTRTLGFRAEARGSVPVGSAAGGSDSVRFDPSQVDPSQLDLAATVSYRVGGGIAVETEVRRTILGENTLEGTRFSFALATSPAVRFWRPREATP